MSTRQMSLVAPHFLPRLGARCTGTGAGGRGSAVPQSLGVGRRLEAEPPIMAFANVPKSHPDVMWRQQILGLPRGELVFPCLPPRE